MNCRIVSLMLVAVCLAGSFALAAGQPEQTDVYVSGREGYHTYRIPSIIVTNRGTVLAFCEGRKTGRGDSGDIDLLTKTMNAAYEKVRKERPVKEGGGR